MSKYYDAKHHSRIIDVEKRHFWFGARSFMIERFVKRYFSNRRDVPYLEVGVGTGLLLPVFESMGFDVHGVDINADAIRLARKKSHAHLVRTSFTSYKPSKRFEAIGMFDVLEHLPNDGACIRHARTLMSKEGTLFLTVPSCPMLYGRVDKESGHLRRYDKKTLSDVLEKNGFRIVSMRYWNTLLFPLYWVWKAVNEHSAKPSVEPFLSVPPEPINILMRLILSIDGFFMQWIPFPIGVTLVVCAQANTLYNTGNGKKIR